MMKKICRVQAPGKIIIAGEHSVVYDKFAVALAIRRYVYAELYSCDDKNNFLEIELLNFNYNCKLNFETANKIYQKITQPEQPQYLVIVTIITTLNYLKDKKLISPSQFHDLFDGNKIILSSDLYVGAGMGSSAACIISIIKVLLNFYNINLEYENLRSLATNIEDFQHGKSSGLDISLSLLGGWKKYCDYRITSIIPPDFGFHVVYTGKPNDKTMQAVKTAQVHIKQLLDKFKNTINNIFVSLQNNAFIDFKNAIKENHKLLIAVGVVPLRVQKFINELELKLDAAAKICGAGSSTGDNAGVLLVVTDKVEELLNLAQSYNYKILTNIDVEIDGAKYI